MWGQGPVVVDDSPPPEEGTQAVATLSGGCSSRASGLFPGPKTQEMDRLENEMQHTLGLMTDALRVQLPFTVEDKKRIVRNLNKINLEYQELTDQPSMINHTRAVLMYMLKELHDVFGNQDAFVEEDSKAAAIEKGTQEANADEEGLARRKRKRSLPGSHFGVTK